MPRFTGQNKKRIDPRYFLDEKCDARFAEKPLYKLFSDNFDDEECRIAAAINSWVERGAEYHPGADIALFRCSDENETVCPGDPYLQQVWSVFKRMLMWSNFENPALKEKYEQKFVEFSFKFACRLPFSLPPSGAPEAVLKFLYGVDGDENAFTKLCATFQTLFQRHDPSTMQNKVDRKGNLIKK